MCPAYAKKAGIECKKWAKFVPGSVEQVQSRTGMGFVPVVPDPATHHFLHKDNDKSTIQVHDCFISVTAIQIGA